MKDKSLTGMADLDTEQSLMGADVMNSRGTPAFICETNCTKSAIKDGGYISD